MHPLDGAFEQLNGAREHIEMLRPELAAFRDSIAEGVSLNYEKGTRIINGRESVVPIGTASFTSSPAPPRASRLIGEVAQNLRVALDYLIYELSCFNIKSTVKQTQFVIVDCEEDFSKEARRRLRHLTAEQKASVQRLQPYAGCHWTGLLRDLSNPSKHRHLTGVRAPVSIRLDRANTDAILAGNLVDMNDYATIQVAFTDGTPVIECLEQLVTDVAQTLADFGPEFERR